MFNLSDEDFQLLLDILTAHLSECQVYAFGSRVQGTNHQWSDLDLNIEGKDPVSSELKEALSESDLPISVDIVDSCSITPAFKKTLKDSKMVRIAKIP